MVMLVNNKDVNKRDEICLVLAPIWDVDSPNLAIASLVGHLKDKFDIKFFDSNIDYYRNESNMKWRINEILSLSYFSNPRKRLLKTFCRLFNNEKIIKKIARKINSNNSKIISFSTYSSNVLFTLCIAREIKKLDSKKIIILGGPSCSSSRLGRHIIRKKYVDYVVVGEGENTFRTLLVKLTEGKSVDKMDGLLFKKNGQIKYNNDASMISNLDNLGVPDFSLFDQDRYNLNSLPIAFCRGCAYRCSFCNQSRFWKNFRFKSAEKIFSEFESMQKMGCKEFVTNNSLDNGNIEVLNSLCDKLIESNMNIRWHGRMRINPNLTPGLIGKLSKAGLGSVTFGLESGSPAVLKKMNKNTDIALTEKILKDLHLNGVRIRSTWMVGFPTEKWKDFFLTLKFVWKIRKIIGGGMAPAYPCSIVPGTELDSDRKKFGIKYVKGTHRWKSQSNSFYQRFVRIVIFRILEGYINKVYDNRKKWNKI